MSAPAKADQKRHTLYRAWKDEELLYIGITINLPQRLTAHVGGASWRDEVTHMTFERLAEDLDRQGALAAEARAIREERPRYNVMGNRTPVPAKPRAPRPRKPPPVEHKHLPRTGFVPLSRLPGILGQIHACKLRDALLDAVYPVLVYEAMVLGGHSWETLSQECGGVSKARVYQLRAQGEQAVVSARVYQLRAQGEKESKS